MGIRMMSAWMLCWVVASTHATPPRVYKCVDGRGHSHYQSAPCDGDKTQAWVREAAPRAAAGPSLPEERPVTHEPAATKPRPRRRAGSVAAKDKVGSARGAIISLHRDAAACERARTARERAFARLGLRRGFMDTRRWDDRVYEACR